MDQQGRLNFQKIRSVCSRWRSISFSSPALWSSLSVEWSDRNDPNYRRRDFLLIEQWFLRAGPTIPLELEYLDPIVSPMADDEKAAVKALIQQHQHQWRSLRLFIHSECLWEAVFSLVPSTWHSLHTLKLDTHILMYLNEERQMEILDALEKMPVRLLCLGGDIAYDCTRRIGSIELQELHFSTHMLAPYHIDLIASYQSLKKLDIDAICGEIWNSTPAHRWTLPWLSSFTCRAHNFSLLQRLTMPSLSDLTLRVSAIAPDPVDDGIVAAFLARCTDALQSVTIGASTNGSWLHELLQALTARPSIRHLNLSTWPSTGGFVEDDGRGWCPKLQDLAISDEFKTEEEERDRMEGLAAFLERRKEGGMQALERLTLRKRANSMFPRAIFDGVALGQLCVVVRW
jgi:hypothetical protein